MKTMISNNVKEKIDIEKRELFEIIEKANTTIKEAPSSEIEELIKSFEKIFKDFDISKVKIGDKS
jgi:hypothetical protein